MTMLRLVVMLVSLSLSICATAATFEKMEPPPRTSQKINVHISQERISDRASVGGMYNVPGSNTFVLYRRGGGGPIVGNILGLGLLTAAVSASMSEEQVKEETAKIEAFYKLELAAMTNAILAAKIKEHAAEGVLISGDTTAARGPAKLTLLPYIVLAFVSDTDYRPVVMTLATISDEKGETVWQSRYVSSIDEDRPLSGPNSWVMDSGKPFKDTVARALEIGLDVLVRDVTGSLPRAAAKQATLKIKCPFTINVIRSQLEQKGVVGNLIETTDKVAVFIPRIGDAVQCSGVHILPRAAADVVKPAQ